MVLRKVNHEKLTEADTRDVICQKPACLGGLDNPNLVDWF